MYKRQIPGLAVAREMLGRGWSVSWLGTAHGMENRLVPAAGIVLDTIAFSGLRGKGALHALTGGLRLLKAFWDCLVLLRRRGADAVLGMGGYVCFPGGMMAALLNRPLLLVNADATLLLSNRSLLPVAGADGGALAAALRRAGRPATVFVADVDALAEVVLAQARDGDVVITMGAGSIGGVPRQLVQTAGVA